MDKILISPKSEMCILGKDIERNSMNLDILLFDPDGKSSSKIMLLGLRRSKTENRYYPTTLHRSEKYKYEKARRTGIESIIWEEIYK